YGLNPQCPKGQACDPDCSCGRFSEVWNLVFTQFNRKDGGVLEPLPAKNIDTGMGLERLAAVVQGKKSNYETDNFTAILKVIKDSFKKQGAQAKERDYRIIADHMRAVVVGISDGVMPSNEGRGYVMRRLIVDAANIIFKAGINQALAYTFVPVVVEMLKTPYPESAPKEKEIAAIIRRIEESVFKLNKEKIPEFEQEIRLLLTQATDVSIKLGKLLFLYHDTHGLPMDVTRALVKGLVSADVFDKVVMEEERLMEEQKDRSRKGSKMTGEVYANQDFSLNLPKTEFLGYSQTKAQAQILKVFENNGLKVILDKTPFYAQGGGQVGDTGYLTTDDNKLKVRVENTRKVNDIYIHDCVLEQGQIKDGCQITAQVDEARRKAIMRNHSCTHLLQAALRDVLGGHVKQQGSEVDENRLRFDFTHPSGLTFEEKKRIEEKVNAWISQSDNVLTEVLSIEQARQKGALAFFAEKYGDTVRVVSMGKVSIEFCGGTHVGSTADIEAVKIIAEGSVAQGIRRLEALTGRQAVNEYLQKEGKAQQAMEQAARLKQDEKQKQNAYFEDIKASVEQMINSAEDVKGVRVVVCSLKDVEIGLLRKLSDLFKQKVKSGIANEAKKYLTSLVYSSFLAWPSNLWSPLLIKKSKSKALLGCIVIPVNCAKENLGLNGTITPGSGN
ncbi:MAG: alanine--tRNA ligase, partial [Candidatus Omnitrophica bacterium]|nr:alanine--tRNA ligase [Candidatus Omnitrophota bacterium]